jgi:hypothetical protein
MNKTIYTEVEVEVEMSDFETVDLVDELENRGHAVGASGREILEQIYLLRRLGRPYEVELDQLLWVSLGRVL